MNLDAARSWAVKEIAGALPNAVEAAIANEGPPEDSTWWTLAFTGLSSPAVWLGAAPAAVNALGGQSGCQDLLAHASSELAKSLSALLLQPVASGEVSLGSAPQGTLDAALAVKLPGVSEAVTLQVRCAESFLRRLAEALARRTAPAGQPSGRIAGLELPVHATLGTASIPLRDVFKLTVGSVIEIGKRITDPVDLVVNDRVIARGLVVICKGAYGLKLTEQLTATGDRS